MAALLGIDSQRTSAAVFILAASLAAVAGLMVSVHYGGIGSLPGAEVGGLLIGLRETMWSAYFEIIYRDVVVFGILVATLVFRPNGLLGRPHAKRVPGPGQPRH